MEFMELNSTNSTNSTNSLNSPSGKRQKENHKKLWLDSQEFYPKGQHIPTGGVHFKHLRQIGNFAAGSPSFVINQESVVSL
ncbi:MAG: hypothetical protein R3264_16655, partial [Anaerolineae bacterium]|nr:hypothetical protein [Anaerolineae bacterium]